MLARLALLLLLGAGPAGAVDWLTIGDPGNPPDTTPAATVATTGLCDGTSQQCRIDAECQPGVSCIKFPWPAEYQSRGAVDYVFQMARLPVSVAEFASYLNATGRDPRAIALTGMDIVVNPGLDIHRTIPPLLMGTTGAYVPLESDFPWPYANSDDAMRYVNWWGDGDETFGSYDCRGTHCDPARLPGATFFLPDLHEWRKAATWDPVSQSWWVQPGNGGAEPEPGVDANVACALGWCSPVGNCNAGTQYPLAECALVANGSYPHFASPWGVEDLCGNGTEISESCGETLGAIDCNKRIGMGIHPWFPSFDCRSPDFQQMPAWQGSFHGTAIRLARTPVPEPARTLLLATGALVLLAFGRLRPGASGGRPDSGR